MRRARQDDILRALARRSAQQAPSIQELSFQGLPGFDDGHVAPGSGFLAICGGTGSGKSALLGLINLALRPSAREESTANYARLSNATMSIKVAYPGAEFEQRHDRLIPDGERGEDFPPGVSFIDIVSRAERVRAYFAENDVEIAKEGKAPFEFDRNTLSLINQVCRREYASAHGYEVEVDENDTVLPFFEVNDGFAAYDSRSMASAELSTFYLAWALHRAEPLSIFLIEEPETYLPPSSHVSVFSLISYISVTNRLGLIITTHSPFVASSSPANSLLSIRRVRGRSVVPVTADSRARVLSRLGLTPQGAAVLFVEDSLAAEILSEIIEAFELRSVCNIEIATKIDGHGGIKTALEGIPQDLQSVTFVGVIDGDAQQETSGWAGDFSVIYLPFRRQMEEELIEAAEAYPAKFAQEIARSQVRVEDALERTRGLDSHDRLVMLANLLGKSGDQLTTIAYQRWLRKINNKASVRKFVRELSNILGISSPLGQ